jgi:hypothetical protein
MFKREFNKWNLFTEIGFIVLYLISSNTVLELKVFRFQRYFTSECEWHCKIIIGWRMEGEKELMMTLKRENF